MFTGNENQEINLTTASAMTKAYRDANPGQILGHFFGKKILEDILAQTGCVGIRVYYGLEGTAATKELVLVGVDSSGNDLTSGVLGDRSFKSPPYTGTTNSLNS